MKGAGNSNGCGWFPIRQGMERIVTGGWLVTSEWRGEPLGVGMWEGGDKTESPAVHLVTHVAKWPHNIQ